jgi:epoxyqueuosine reductase
MTPAEKSNLIKSLAFEAGFNACGIAKIKLLNQDAIYYKKYLDEGFHAGMDYLLSNFEKRTNPGAYFKNAKSIIVVLLNYNPVIFPFENKKLKIARYSLGADYHDVVKDKLVLLFEGIKKQIGATQGHLFIDSGTVQEKAWAREAGLGWIGHNSLLLDKKSGSYNFIGCIITDLELEYDKPVDENCGNCRLCIEACPTKAIVKPKIVDARKCISYNTIETKADIPVEIGSKMNGWIYGCDICQEVCPWNRKTKFSSTPEFNPLSDFYLMKNDDWIQLLPERFNKLFVNSPVKRIKYDKLKRNITSCIITKQP